MEPVFNLKGKTVVITGAGGLLGREYVKNFLVAGMNVVACDLKLEALLECKEKYPTQLEFFVGDITVRAQVKMAVAAALERFQRIDCLHHNCSFRPKDFYQEFEHYTMESWRGVMSGNIETSLPLNQEVIPIFKQQKSGTILFTSSIYGISGADQRIYEGSWYEGQKISTPAAYSSAKAAIIGLMQHLAAELAPWNIRVNAITPGGVESGQNDIFKENYSRRVPLGRMAQPSEMVGPAIFLMSDAASYITGHNLVVDGGLTCW